MPKSIMIDISGHQFGFLTAIKPIEKRKDKLCWLCQCSCGDTVIVRGDDLRREKVFSCGCWRREAVSLANTIHGAAANYETTPEYRTWKEIRRRCTNSNCRAFKDYGGRGIKVCERWDSFDNFLKDMGPRPGGRYSIERIDVNGHYEPSNCKWLHVSYQNKNKRNTKRPNQ